jgi:phage FluMu gp28-like protein
MYFLRSEYISARLCLPVWRKTPDTDYKQEMKFHIERLLKQNQSQIMSLMIDFLRKFKAIAI